MSNDMKSYSFKRKAHLQNLEIKALKEQKAELLSLLMTTFGVLLDGSPEYYKALKSLSLRVCLDRLLSAQELRNKEICSVLKKLRKYMIDFSLKGDKIYQVTLQEQELSPQGRPTNLALISEM